MILFLTTILSMLALGWIVWVTVQKQEERDERFQEKLRADDERARRGREASQLGRTVPPEDSRRS